MVSGSSPGAAGPDAVAIADLTAAGRPDLAIAHAQATGDGARSVSVLYALAGGGFRTPRAYATGGLSARAVVVADMAGDHVPDLVVSHDWVRFADRRHATVSVLAGRRSGGFSPASAT